jgi:hypothetical protein
VLKSEVPRGRRGVWPGRWGRMAPMRRRTRIAPPKALAGYFCILTMVVISCNVSTLLPLTPTTVPPTMTAAQTALPVSPTAMPSATPLPTDTAMPTPTESVSDQLSCKVLSQSMKNNRHFGPREDFEMGWLVRNNGTAAWDPSSMVFTYFSGTKMYLFSPAHLQTTVNHGDEVALGASLMAPKSSGAYTTVWALRQGTYNFCYVSIRIIVP